MNKLIINKEKKYQIFENFGVSGAWWSQVIGGWIETDPESGISKCDRITQLLFDKEKGIGINCYRYNLGAGSMQSKKGHIENECRRAESFKLNENEYNWNNDSNAVKILKKAVENGVEEIIFFVNSPPEFLTRNGKSHLDKPLHTNLPKNNYKAFADYCLDCVEHFISEGIPIKYISPVNEPVWVWTGGQEGCHYRPLQVYKVMKTFAEEIDKRPALKDLKLSGAENGDIRWFNNTYVWVMMHDKLIRNKIDAIDTHSYFITPHIPIIEKFIGNRVLFMKRFRKLMDKRWNGFPIKTSEWCHMQGGRDYGMDSALEQTKIMMQDLSILNVTSWQLWIAVSNVDYCDGLIYENDDTRTFELTKRYYAFGHFSKFIKPGSIRIEVNAGNGLDSVGFINNKETVIVISNRNHSSKEVELPFINADIYLTDKDNSLERINYNKDLHIPEKAIITIIAKE